MNNKNPKVVSLFSGAGPNELVTREAVTNSILLNEMAKDHKSTLKWRSRRTGSSFGI